MIVRSGGRSYSCCRPRDYRRQVPRYPGLYLKSVCLHSVWWTYSHILVSVFIMQWSKMAHCAPEATLNPTCFQFTPKTAVGNCFGYASVLDGWSNQTRGPAAASFCRQMCCVCVDRSRCLGPSETKRMSSAKLRRCLAGQRRVSLSWPSRLSTTILFRAGRCPRTAVLRRGYGYGPIFIRSWTIFAPKT